MAQTNSDWPRFMSPSVEDTRRAGHLILVAPEVAARSDDAPAAFALVWSTSAPSDAALPSS